MGRTGIQPHAAERRGVIEMPKVGIEDHLLALHRYLTSRHDSLVQQSPVCPIDVYEPLTAFSRVFEVIV
jgi:hypothetical protein